MKSISKFLDRSIVRSGQKIDMSLLWMVVLMTAFSLMMIYSASIAYAAGEEGTKWSFVLKQAAFVAGSVAVCGGAALFMPMYRWKKFTPWYLIGCFVLLCAVLVLGREINGARRWIHLGPVNLQPTEMFKLAVVLYLSSFFTRRVEVLKQAKKILFPGAVVGIGLALMMLQPDFGSFVVVTVVAMGMLFLAGFPWKYFVMMLAAAMTGMVSLIAVAPYRMARVSAFLNPWEDPLGKGYQLTHSLMAIGKGEWLGSGLGAGVAKLNFLPEPHTDFLFATIGEELGMVGMLVVILMFFWVVRRCFEIGRQAIAFEEFFNGLVAQGIGLWIGLQVFINLGVNLGLLPTKGLTLPFMSFGGTAILMNCVAMAIVLRIDVENRRLMRGKMA